MSSFLTVYNGFSYAEKKKCIDLQLAQRRLKKSPFGFWKYISLLGSQCCSQPRPLGCISLREIGKNHLRLAELTPKPLRWKHAIGKNTTAGFRSSRDLLHLNSVHAKSCPKTYCS